MTDDIRRDGDDSSNDNNNSTADLAAAYALNALSPEERIAFETRLGESEETRNEVTELTATASLLGLAVEPVVPSAELRANIMGLIATTPQLPRVDAASSPDAASTPEATSLQSTPAASPRAVRALPPIEAFDEFAEQGPTRATATPAERRAKGRWLSRPLTVLAAAAAAVVLLIGGGVVSNSIGEAQFQQAQAGRLAAINAADDVQRLATDVATGGTATLIWSDELGQSAVVLDGVDALPSDSVYQLWYINDAGITAAGTLSIVASGTTWRVLDGDLSRGDTIGITIEPRGGSEQPTTDPIAAIQSA
jgi:anti-sigma-K factor RskA